MMAEVTTTILTMSKILMTKEATRCQEVVIGVATTASAGHAENDQDAHECGTPKKTLRVDKEDP